jgi:hypothetical protein
MVAAVVLVVGLAILGRVLYASYSAELERLEADRRDAESQLTQARQEAFNLKGLDERDPVVWLDELYDLTARIRDVNALRVTSISCEPLQAKPNARFVGRFTIKGRLLTRGDRSPLDQLIAEFRKAGYYNLETPGLERGNFTLVVSVERRAPDKYTDTFKVETPKPADAGDAAGERRGRPGRAAPEAGMGEPDGGGDRVNRRGRGPGRGKQRRRQD